MWGGEGVGFVVCVFVVGKSRAAFFWGCDGEWSDDDEWSGNE